MQKTYTTFEGETVTREEIAQAFRSGNAYIVYGYPFGDKPKGEDIRGLSLLSYPADTRSTSLRWYDAIWKKQAKSLRACISATEENLYK